MEREVNLFPHVITANAMFRRSVFDKVGLFDERFPSAGGEDLDLGWRVHRAGYRMKYSPSARVVHRHKSSIRQLFRQHYRYGYGWTVIVRKHKDLFKNAGPSCWGVYPEDIRAFRAAVRDYVGSVCTRGLTQHTRFCFYHLIRQLGEYSGKFAATVSR
ncbi:MAG: glycosyltransferase [Candidatus Aureabacteria bacterium]|nr:glycosyltransferase [Candidatus Auribacterota bacterium]